MIILMISWDDQQPDGSLGRRGGIFEEESWWKGVPLLSFWEELLVVMRLGTGGVCIEPRSLTWALEFKDRRALWAEAELIEPRAWSTATVSTICWRRDDIPVDGTAVPPLPLAATVEVPVLPLPPPPRADDFPGTTTMLGFDWFVDLLLNGTGDSRSVVLPDARPLALFKALPWIVGPFPARVETAVADELLIGEVWRTRFDLSILSFFSSWSKSSFSAWKSAADWAELPAPPSCCWALIGESSSSTMITSLLW